LCNGNSLLFVISQSGESKEVVDLCKLLQSDDNLIIVTNQMKSDLYRRGTVKFLLYAGDEYLTATKTFTNTVAAVLFISNLIVGCFGGAHDIFRELAIECIKIMESVINADSDEMALFFKNARYICLVGGSASYCTASHAQLVVEEAGKMFATRYLPAQFLHGPVELINEDFNAVLFDFSEDTRAEIDRIVKNILEYGGRVCVITNRDINMTNERLLVIKLDIFNEFYAPLVEVIPVELCINKIGLMRGLNPGVLTRVRK